MRGPLYVISVWNCRATVCRRRDLDASGWTYEPATNWQELEDDAIYAVELQGGAVNMSALYLCPTVLIERAIFETEEADDYAGEAGTIG